MAETRLLTEPWHRLSEGQQLAALRCAYDAGKRYAQEWKLRPPAEAGFYIDRCISGSGAIIETAWKELGDKLCEEPRVCQFVYGYEEQRRRLLLEDPIPEDLETLKDEYLQAKRYYEQAIEERNRTVLARASCEDHRRKEARQLGEIVSVVRQIHGELKQEYELALILYRAAQELEPRPSQPKKAVQTKVSPKRLTKPKPAPREKVAKEDPLARLSPDLKRKLEEILPHTTGRRAVLVGGIERPEQRQLLEKAFAFSELRWSEPGKTGNYFERCERDIQWAELVFYLRYNRKASRKTWHLCGPERPLISLADGGYGLSRVIEQTHSQLLCKRGA